MIKDMTELCDSSDVPVLKEQNHAGGGRNALPESYALEQEAYVAL